MITYTNGYVANFDGMSPTYFDGTMPVSVYFYIKQDGRDIVSMVNLIKRQYWIRHCCFCSTLI